MKIFLTLFGYEIRKIIKHKIVWVCLPVLLLVVFFTVIPSLFGNYMVEGKVVDTHYNMFLTDQAYQKKLNGRLLDQSLLREMQEGYGHIPLDKGEHYTLTEEYQTYARPYSMIFNYVMNIGTYNPVELRNMQLDETVLLDWRRSILDNLWKDSRLQEREIAYWEGEEQKIEQPMRFTYHEGYERLLYSLPPIITIAILVIGICLAGVFTEEHSRRTDQLILSSRHGKSTIYWAKFTSGMIFALITSLVTSGAAFLCSFILFGTDGFGAALQWVWVTSSCPLSVGEAVLVTYGILLFICFVTAAFTMTISEILRGNIATVSLIAGTVLLSMFINIPQRQRVIAQLWNYVPCNFSDLDTIFDPVTVPFFGQRLASWQAVPLIYICLCIVFALIGMVVYKRYQIKGR